MSDTRFHVRGRSAALIAVLAILGGSLVGCGDGGEDEPDETTARPASVKAPRDLFVTSGEIRSQGDRPAAALLGWWRALQFLEITAAQRAYQNPPPARVLTRQARSLASNIRTAKPEIVETEAGGNNATLYVFIRSADFSRPGAPRVTESPATFQLTRVGRGWKLRDNRFLEELLAAQQAGRPQREETPGSD